jgi:hypothetical protein
MGNSSRAGSGFEDTTNESFFRSNNPSGHRRTAAFILIEPAREGRLGLYSEGAPRGRHMTAGRGSARKGTPIVIESIRRRMGSGRSVGAPRRGSRLAALVSRRSSILFLFAAFLVFAVVVVPAGAAPGDYVESFGPDGTAATEFPKPAALAVDQGTGAVYVGDSQTQVLYKFDADGNPLAYGGSEPYILSNEITGLEMNGGNAGTSEVAVDPNTHVVYVTSGNNVRAFETDGEPHKFTEGPGAGTSEIPGADTLYGVAVDASGNIYADDFGSEIVRIYSRTGLLITEFTPMLEHGIKVRPGTVAVAADGTLYITDYESSVVAFEPSRFPVTGKTTYDIGQRVNDHTPQAVAVDPATQYVYIGENCPGAICAQESRVSVYDEQGQFVGTLGGEGPGEIDGAVAGLGIFENRLYFVDRGEGGTDKSQVSVFEALPLPVGPPMILGTNVTNITSSSAVLRARLNPNTLETTYWFEYGLEDCAVSPGACTKVPSDGASAGAGHLPTAVSAPISGLSAGTKYFYRVVAENSEPEGGGLEEGPTRTFTTQAGQFGSALSDNRVWEQVTPADKFGGGISNSGTVQAAKDGSGIAFETRGSIIEDPDGNRALETASVLARRSGSGWAVDDLEPPHNEATGQAFGPEFKIFSPDLGKALLEPRDDSPLSPETSERAPHLRINTIPPSYRPLVTSKEGFANVPAGTVFGGEQTGARNPVAVSGADGSLSHVVIFSRTPLIEGAERESLYLWSDSNGSLEPVSELPGGGVVTAQLGSGAISVRHAVSEDGSRVFWAPGAPGDASLTLPALYLRDTAANETVRIDVPEDGVSGPGEEHPAFMAASADGSVVFFTDSQQLSEDASLTGRDLYRCEVGDVSGSLGCTDIEDLSAPLPGSGESGEAEEVAVGVSEDGGSIYFIARAKLDPEPNAAGEMAVPGSRNLYLWQKGPGVRFIASLSEEDNPDWGEPPRWTNEVGNDSKGTANSSPDGRYLVFMSEQNLGSVETPDPESAQPVEQAFRYDSVEDQLICISCNPSGATDSGIELVEGSSEIGIISPDPMSLWEQHTLGTTLPERAVSEPVKGYNQYWPRAVLDNGRTYFNSVAPLVTGDSNGTWDVYQYEPFGLGDCSTAAGSGMVATTASACVSMISGGADSQPSVFMDASETGDDVFFATFARLSTLDTDPVVDVYDARVNGVAAAPEQHPECGGEACQQRGAPPNGVAPNSSSFNGAGNLEVKPRKHCHRGQRKVRRKGKVKCVPKKKSAGHGKKKGGSR